MKYKITNVINSDVVIEDLSIRLSGKGKSIVIDADIANKSRDLLANRHLVKIDKIETVAQTPMWPFIKNQPASSLQSVQDTSYESVKTDSVSQKDIDEIKSMLSNILVKINSKQETKTIIIEKTNSLFERTDSDPNPMFIPSQITPDQAEVNIKLKENEISKNDLNRGVQALKRLKSKVK